MNPKLTCFVNLPSCSPLPTLSALTLSLADAPVYFRAINAPLQPFLPRGEVKHITDVNMSRIPSRAKIKPPVSDVAEPEKVLTLWGASFMKTNSDVTVTSEHVP